MMTKHTIVLSSVSQCGIYDLNQQDWTEVAPYEYCVYYRNSNNFQMDMGTQMTDENKLYVVTDIGYTSQYDFIKNEWHHLYECIDEEDMLFHGKPLVWTYMESPKVLYCIGKRNRDSKSIICRRFDVREHQTKWTKCMEHVEEKNVFDSASFFLQ